jgi:hypothetical protein
MIVLLEDSVNFIKSDKLLRKNKLNLFGLVDILAHKRDQTKPISK